MRAAVIRGIMRPAIEPCWHTIIGALYSSPAQGLAAAYKHEMVQAMMLGARAQVRPALGKVEAITREPHLRCTHRMQAQDNISSLTPGSRCHAPRGWRAHLSPSAVSQHGMRTFSTNILVTIVTAASENGRHRHVDDADDES